MTIPKILHFTWKTEEVPGVMAAYLARWRELHPDWDIRLWTDASMRDFVARTYPDFLGAYDAYPRPIQRADSFRYLVLNALGGVYSDLDVEPFRAIDPMVEGVDCFAGVEPDEHMGSDRWHSGAPFLVTNAFQGGVMGHPWFRELVDLLPITAGIADIFQSTGPGVTTAAALRLKREDRPRLVLPQQWSPTIDGGKPCRTDNKLRAMLTAGFDFVDLDGQFVAHRWISTWVPWHKRVKWAAKPFHMMHAAKWAFRRWRHKDLAAVDIADARWPYFDQFAKPPAAWPKVAVCVVGTDKGILPSPLRETISNLDYPADRLSVTALGDDGVAAADHGDWTDAHRRMAHWSALANQYADDQAVMAADWVLFVDGGVSQIPDAALKAMLSADKPVVALGARDASGAEADHSVFRYHWGGGIRVVYKIGAEDGIADARRGQRDFLADARAFAYVPLDGVGQSLVLVRRDVLEAGVRFAEQPYHLHLGGEGFALQARHEGFEAAGLTAYWVTK